MQGGWKSFILIVIKLEINKGIKKNENINSIYAGI